MTDCILNKVLGKRQVGNERVYNSIEIPKKLSLKEYARV